MGWLLAAAEASCPPPVLWLHVRARSFRPPSLCSLLLSLDQMQQQQMGMNGMGMLPNMRPPGMPMLGVESGAASVAGPDGPQQQLMLQQQAYMMQQQQAYCNMMMHAQQQQMPQAQESMQAGILSSAEAAEQSSLASRGAQQSPRMPTHNVIKLSVQELSKYFKMPEKAVAKHLGIDLTSLKKICRANGINRWPYRKVRSVL